MTLPGSRIRRPLLAMLAGVVATLSCGRDITGPDGAARIARGFTFELRFPPMAGGNSVASDLIPFTKVRIVLRNLAGAIVVNRVVDFPSTADEVELSLSVPLSFDAPATGETMDITLAFANASGDTVFRAGPVPVLVVPSSSGTQPPPPPVLAPVFTGTGANAESVVISPDGVALVAGDPFTFTAVALDGQGSPIANTTFGWSSLDVDKATVTNAGAGAGVTLPSRGTARIVADIANGKADTVVITIAPRLQALVKVSGDAQTGPPATELGQAAVVRVTATDGLPLEGVTVNFAAANGGSVGTPSAVSGVDGLVQTTWTLGPGAGAQTMTATVAGSPAVVTTFTATATAPALTLLHHYPMTGNVNDAVGTAHGTLQGSASVLDGVLSLDGEGEFVQFAQHLVPTAGSYSVAFFLRSRMSAALGASYLTQGGPSGLSIGQFEGGLSVTDGWQFTGEPAPNPDGLYHHLALVVDAVGNTSRLYVDGILEQTIASAIAVPVGGLETRLGRRFATGEYFVGEMDEVRIYSGTLNAAEVAALHDAGPTTPGRLVFQQQPTNVGVGAPISPAPTVRVEDAMGRLKTTFNGNVTMAIAANPGGGTLGGTVTIAAVAGVATFSNLTISAAGDGYTLLATASGHQDGNSATFDVVAGGPVVNAWTNPAGGAWTTASNWSEGRVPNATDSVVIALDGTYTVTFSGSATLANLTVGDGAGARTLAMSTSSVLTVNGMLTVRALSSISINGATVNGTGILWNEGTIAANTATLGITVQNFGLYQVQDVVTQSGFLLPQPGSTLRVQGSSGFGAATMTVANGFNNAGAIELTSVGSGFNSQLNVTNGTLGNAPGGTISALPGVGGSRTLAAQIFNEGTITVSTALTLARASSAHVNDGTINVSGANLTVTQSGTTPTFSNVGAIAIGSGRTLTVTGGALVLSGGTVDGYAGTLATSGTELTFAVAEARTRLAFGAGTTIPANLTIPAGDSLRLVTGTLTTPILTVDGTLIVEDAVSIASALTATSTSSIVVRGSQAYGAATLTVANGFANNGTINLTSVVSGFNATLAITTGTLLNAPSGVIVSSAGVGGSRALNVQLNNQGVVTVNNALTLSRTDAVHVNSGTINLAGDNLTVTQSGTGSPSFSNTGAITMSNGRTLTVSGGALNLTGGTVSNYAATLSTSSTTLTFTVPEARTRLAFGAGTVIPAAFTIPAGDSLRLVTGTFTTPTLQVDGDLIAEDVVAISGVLTTGPAPARLIVRGSQAYGAATLTVANGFTNTGTIEMTSVVSGFNAAFNVTTGTLTNSPTGVILSSAGVGGSRTLGAQLDNQGVVTVNNALSLNKPAADHLNSGTIALAGDNLTIAQGGTDPSFANTGTITMTNGRTLTVTGGALVLTGGTLSNYAATLSTSGTTVTFTVPEARTRLAFGAGTVIPTGFTIPAGDSLRLVTGTFTAPTLQNDGQLIIEDVVTVTGAITTGTGSTILVRGSQAYGAATLSVATGLTNTATINLTSVVSGFNSTLNVTAGTLVNGPTGTILSSAGVGGSRILDAVLDNQGTITVANVLTLQRAGADHLNSGTIALTGDNLGISLTGTTPTFTNTGAITMANGRTLTVSGGALILTGGTLSGYGATLATSATAITFTVPEARTRLAFGAGTTIPAPFTVPAGDSLRLVTGTFNAPTLQNDGDLIIEDVVSITSALTTGPAPSRIIIRGSQAYGAATLTVANGFTNNSTIDLTSIISGFNATLNVATGTLVNAPGATILSSAGVGGSRILGVQLDNQGTVTVANVLTLTKADAVHLNSGTISLTGDNLTVTQTGTGSPSFSNTGTITMSSGRTLTVSGGALSLTGGTLSGYGATLSTTNTTLAFTVPEARTRLAFGTGTVIPSAFTIPAGDSLRLVTGTFNAPTLQNDGDLIIEDVVSITSAVTTGPAPSRIVVRGSQAYGAATLTVANGFTNTSTIDLTSVISGFNATLVVTNGTLVNGSTGTILSSAGVGGSRALGLQLDNQGVMTVNAGMTLARADADHVNSGTINLAGENLSITQSGAGTPSFSNAGTITMTNGRTLTVSGGAFDMTGGTISNYAATLSTSNTTLTFTVPEARTRLAFGTGTTIPAAFTVPAGDSLRLVTGTFNAPTLLNNGDLIIEDAVAITSAITTGPSPSRIIVRGSQAYGASTLTVANGFTNTSTIDLTSVVSGFNATLVVTSGTLTNGPTGTILLSPGVGGSRSLGVQLDNQGTVTVNTGAVLARADADHLNSGVINLVGDNLTITQTGTTPSFTNTGAINLSAGRTLSNSNGALVLTGGTVSGYGATLAASGATTLTFTVPEARTRLSLAAGTIIPGTFTVPAGDSLRLITGSFTAPNLTLNGKLVVEDVVTVTSAITTGLPSDTAIVVRGSQAFGAATLTVSNFFVNTGIIHLTSVVSGFNSTLNVTTGGMANASGALILASAGVGGSRTLGAPLSQNGLLQVNAGTTLTTTGMLTLNPGSTTTVLGTLVKSGGCTQNGGIITGGGTGASCP